MKRRAFITAISGMAAGAIGLKLKPINRSMATGFANWTAPQHMDITKTDLLRKMRRAHSKTVFCPPINLSMLRKRQREAWERLREDMVTPPPPPRERKPHGIEFYIHARDALK